MRLETFTDPELGTIAAARDDDGNIIATATDTHRNGVRIILDEGHIFAATGMLIPTANEVTDAMPEELRP